MRFSIRTVIFTFLSISTVLGAPLGVENVAGGALTGDKMSVVPGLVNKALPGGQSKETSSNLSPAGGQQGRPETLERPENPERH